MELRIALIGHKFMGRAHTHAFVDLPIFFDLDGVRIVKKVICAAGEDVKEIARKWGWEEWSTNWEEVINREDIDIVDIAASNAIHAPVAIKAAENKKHIFCEKPLALTLEEARKMVEAVKKADVVNMIGFNYRRVPALAFAKQLIDKGYLGEIYHFRAIYQQSWLIDPNYPLVWRLRKKEAGFGALGDLASHIVDIARFLIGEIEEVCGTFETFIEERPLPAFVDGLIAKPGKEKGKVDVDDAVGFLAKFKNKKTLAYFEATRYGTGHRNQNRIEVNGSKGAIIFDMEKMNELQFYSEEDPKALQGFRRIIIGESSHPYMTNWWPAGHIIGYGDTFVNQFYDFIMAIKNGEKVKPDFEDGFINMKVLYAVYKSVKEKRWVKVEEI